MWLASAAASGARCGRKGCKAYFGKIGHETDETNTRDVMMNREIDLEDEGAS